MKRTSPILLKLVCNSRTGSSSHNYFNYRTLWSCETCDSHQRPSSSSCRRHLIANNPGIAPASHRFFSSDRSSTNSAFDEREHGEPTEEEHRSQMHQPKPGQSKIVQRNWDKYYEGLRRRKKFRQQFSRPAGAQEEEQEDDHDMAERDLGREVQKKQKPKDPSDDFGSLTIGDTGIRVQDRDASSKLTKEQVDELETSIYSIDAPEEAGDIQVVPEDPKDRMNFRQLKIRTKALIRENRLTEALDLFTQTMKLGGIHYDLQDLGHTYSVLIYGCGQIGHIKQAWKLFQEMKERGCKVVPSVYTSLFNAIANSVGDKEQNLEKLERLKVNMLEKGFTPNLFHYHVMIKAYGRLGQLQSAFALVDEMIRRSLSDSDGEPKQTLRPTVTTFSFLLQACISDKQNGFRHALVTWRKMMELRIPPDAYIFRLFLRAVRECGIVVPKSVRRLLGEPIPSLSSPSREYQSSGTDGNEEIEAPIDLKMIPPMIRSDVGFDDNCALILTDLVDTSANSLQEQESNRDRDRRLDFISGGSELLNLLRNSCTPGTGVQALLNYPHNRLAILGGLKAIISEMKYFNVPADLKSATELAQIVAPVEIQDLLNLMYEDKVRPDTDFYNLLIKKYIMCDQLKETRDVLKMMHKSRLHPNVMTWGIFSLACKNWSSAKRLLKDIDQAKMEPNIQIMGGLLGTATRNFDSRYVIRVMEEIGFRGIQPDPMFVEKVINFRSTVQKGIVNWEQNLEVTPFALQTQLRDNYDHFMDYYTKFKLRYESWLAQVPEKVMARVRRPEDIEDPWKDDFNARKAKLKEMRMTAAAERN